MDEAFHKWMSHVTYEWVMSRICEGCHLIVYNRIMSHMWITIIPYEWVMSHLNKYITYGWGILYRNESMSESIPIWMRRFINEWDMSHMCEDCQLHTEMLVQFEFVPRNWLITSMRYELSIAYEWFMPHHIVLSQVTHTHEWVGPLGYHGSGHRYMWTSQVKDICEWVGPHGYYGLGHRYMWTRDICEWEIYLNERYMWMSQVTCM